MHSILRIFLLLISIFLATGYVSAQRLFPVKIQKKWGLINAEGRLVTKPVYDAIGEFKHFGFAIFQRDNKVGLFDSHAIEIISPVYNDIKVLDSTIISVSENGTWKVIDLGGKTILSPGYTNLKMWNNRRIGFQKEGKWGMVDYEGNILVAPVFDKIQPLDFDFFSTEINDWVGVIDYRGVEILSANFEDVRIWNEDLIFYKKDKKWGAVNQFGTPIIPCRFDHYQIVSDYFVKLFEGKSCVLFSKTSESVIASEHDNYYPFSNRMVIVKSNRHLGLLDECGDWVLPVSYNEIQRFGRDYFRINLNGQWGIAGTGGSKILPVEYDYVAPLRGNFSLLKKGSLFGLCNFHGEMVIPTNYTNFEIEEGSVKAYHGTDLTLFGFDREARLMTSDSFSEHFTIVIGTSDNDDDLQRSERFETEFVLDNYEWFYAPQNDKWGLRSITDGSVKIEPVFDVVKVDKELGLTLVGILKPQKMKFDRTNYRFETVFGLVKNETGVLLTEINLWDIQLRDFKKGHHLARCMFENGRFGLMLKTGTIIIKDLVFVDEYVDGVARAANKGRLTGSIDPAGRGLGSLNQFLTGLQTPNVMADYTAWDQEFNREAQLTCEECVWGYLDTLGRYSVSPQYHFARNFLNEVGIVESNGKWGAVSPIGKQIIPFEFDDISFLDDTDNKIIRIYKKEEKYGLVDTLGELKVSAVFDDIGSFSEGKLAVKRNNLWGFINRLGHEVVPCRFQKVENFCDGLAAVKMGNQWGFVDIYGDVVIRGEFSRVGNFSNGLAWVTTKNGTGFIDTLGRMVIKDQFQRAYDFQFGVARIVIDSKFGLIDKEGVMRLSPKYSDIGEFNEMGLAIVRYGTDNIRYGVINIKGEQLTKLDFREILPFHEGFAAVRYKDSYGFINLNGELVVSAKYSKVSDFSEGLAAVQIDGKCGYIDQKGNWVIEPQYSRCLNFKDGKAVVYQGMRKAGLVDRNGNKIIEPQINRLLEFSEGRGLVRDSSYHFYYITEQAKKSDGVYYQKASGFRHGVAVVQMDGKWGIINQKGLEIIPPKYDRISQFESGYAKVRIKGFNGLTNTQGETIIQPDYEYISYAGEGLFRVEQGDKIGYFDSSGNWVWDLRE